MVIPRIYGHRRRLFLREHREAHGVSAETMAGRLRIERESVYRLEKEAMTRASPGKQIAYAEALGIEPWELWHPPHTRSVDAMLADAPEDVRTMAADIVRRLISNK